MAAGKDDKDRVFSIQGGKEGFGTLVAQLSFLQCDTIIEQLTALRGQGKSENEIQTFLDKRASDMDTESRSKLLTLSKGETPADDFTPADCASSEMENELTLKARLADSDHRLNTAPNGSIVFHQGQRWVLVSAAAGVLTFKRF